MGSILWKIEPYDLMTARCCQDSEQNSVRIKASDKVGNLLIETYIFRLALKSNILKSFNNR